MRAIQLKTSLLLFALAGLASTALEAQQFRTVSALNALEQVQQRFGPDSVTWISEMKATGGQPQPLQWDIVAFNSAAPGLLHHFRASSGVVQDGGPDGRRYPNEAPNGFFNLSAIGVDSIAAFTIAEAEARKARIGFDSCDYFLELREFSNETVWRLELVDANHRLVGSIYISGTNGQVLRTIWMQPDSISGFPTIIDSASPVARSFSGPAQPPAQAPPVNNGGIMTVPSPYAPVTPQGGMVQTNPIPSTNPPPSSTPGRTSSIFRQFPSSGGGSSSIDNNSGSSTVMTPSNNPLDPTPAPVAQKPTPTIRIPKQEETIPLPIEPDQTSPAPPINVQGSGGSSDRIPPPPVPQ